jgi:type II secretory pathway pseudopilin PulG
MIVGIAAFPLSLALIGVLLAPVAIVLGIIAIRKANKQPHVYGGKGFAIAGIAAASVVCLFVPMIAAIAIPNLLAARRAANEASAVSAIKLIASAQEVHVEMDPDGECGDLADLAAAKLINADLAIGKRNGYKLLSQGSVDDVNGCEIQATPASKSEGTRSFYYSSSDNILRVAVDGLPADHNDPPAESTRVSN